MEILRNLFLAPKRGNHNLFAAALNMLLASCFIVAVFWLSLKAINVEFDFRTIPDSSLERICDDFVRRYHKLVSEPCDWMFKRRWSRLAPTCGKIFL